MNRFNSYNSFYISILTIVFLLFSSLNTIAKDNCPVVENGVLNLSDYSFEDSGTIFLKGRWKFYWNKFLTPAQIKKDTSYGFLKVPKSWKNQPYKNQILPVHGYGTYYLKIIMNKKYRGKILKINSKYIPTASKVFLNGKLIGYSGKTGINKEETGPSINLIINEFKIVTDTLILTVQVSSFHTQKAGINYNMELGTAKMVNGIKEISNAKDFFVIGAIFLMMLYHFVLYFLRRKDKSTLFFALSCLAFAFYALALSDIFLMVIPDLGFEVLFKLKRLALYLSLPAMTLFLYHLFPKDVSSIIVKIIVIGSLLFSFGVIVFNSSINSYFITYFRYFGLVTAIFLLYIIVKAIINNRDGAVIFTIGLALMFMSIINDFLYNTRVINTTDLMPAGMFLFLFSQAYLLSFKFNKSYAKNEKLTTELLFINKNLEGIVEERTQEISLQKNEIEEKNEELNQLIEEVVSQRDKIEKQKEIVEEIHREVSQSIDYATRLQRSILPDMKILSEHLSDFFVLFKPRDKVSGDFYWWTHAEGKTIITAADCTGHGVPGAFMSMLGVSFLREIVTKEYITHTGVILRKLRKEIIRALKQKGEVGEQKDGMDISIISIDHRTNKIQFSGAYNPLYIVTNRKLDGYEYVDNLIQAEESINKNKEPDFFYEIKADKMPIAIYLRMDKFKTQEIQLQKGDRLYMFSDGYADQFGGLTPKGKKFKSKAFKKLLFENANKAMEEQKEILNTTYENWRGDFEQVDDVVVIGIKI